MEIYEDNDILVRSTKKGDSQDIKQWFFDKEVNAHLLKASTSLMSRFTFSWGLDKRVSNSRFEIFSVVNKTSGEVIGLLDFTFSDDGKECERTLGLKHEHWRKGIISKASNAAISYMFEVHSDLKTIVSHNAASNVAAGKLAIKEGFKNVGTVQSRAVTLSGESVHDLWHLDRENWQGKLSSQPRPESGLSIS